MNNNHELKEVELPLDKEYNWIQSANALFNFMREPDYLKTILTNMAIIPRYYPEYVEYLEVDNIKKISYPMTCFCDIPINKLIYHIKNYGNYGIGLDKEKWGLKNGLQPIKYVNPKSNLLKDFSMVFKEALTNEEASNQQYQNLKNYLISDLLFTKPIKGKMDKRKDNKLVTEETLFQDECEWRFVPTFNNSIDIPIIVPQNTINATKGWNLNYCTQVIENHKELWLNFKIEDIRYILVPNESANKEFIRYIMKELKNISDEDKLILISKIFNIQNLKEDM